MIALQTLFFNSNLISWFFFFTQWQNIAMLITMFLLLCKTLYPQWYIKAWSSFGFKAKYVIPAAIGVSIIFIRELFITSLPKIAGVLPYFTYWEQIVVFMSTTHLRSIMFFGLMIFYLWRKFDRLLPAMIIGWFALAVVEFSYVPQLWISTGGFIGLDWYLPFAGVTVLFLLERKRFKLLTKGFSAWFIAGLFFQYFLLLFRWAGLTIWDPATGSFPLNPVALPFPPWETWMFEFLNHLVKTLWAVAFCYVILKKTEQKQRKDSCCLEQKVQDPSRNTEQLSKIDFHELYDLEWEP